MERSDPKRQHEIAAAHHSDTQLCERMRIVLMLTQPVFECRLWKLPAREIIEARLA
ncbi:MAG: hypothetical protein IT440_10130 [Phycisphaeraceae bacterium]|nr:hypothetical protein [Phycisphaeraceae bacterium]